MGQETFKVHSVNRVNPVNPLLIRGGEKMFLVEERRNGQRRAAIYMRPDGLFEGRIYRQTSDTASESIRAKAEFEICGVTETLPRVETLVDEELGL
jgi:hypothetical protein